MDFHLTNGGISRYAKFEYFIDYILPVHSPGTIISERSAFLSALVTDYAEEVKSKLFKCETVQYLEELRQCMTDSRWFIVSGGDQAELREVFDKRGLTKYFDGGIFGSPNDKHSIVEGLLKSKKLESPILSFGDSRLDHEVAKTFGFDFIFVSQWTEFSDWQNYCRSEEFSRSPV